MTFPPATEEVLSSGLTHNGHRQHRRPQSWREGEQREEREDTGGAPQVILHGTIASVEWIRKRAGQHVNQLGVLVQPGFG